MKALPIVLASVAIAAGDFSDRACAQDAPDWRVSIVEADWTFVGESEGVVSLARRHPTDNRLVEFRYEYRDSQLARSVPRLTEAFPAYTQARSATAIVEFDCNRGRRLSHEETIYSGRNLSGAPLLRRQKDRAWMTVEPGTVGSQQMEWACSTQRSFR